MKLKNLFGLTLVFSAMTLGTTIANASVSAKTVFDGEYSGNTISCFVCHVGTPGALTTYGTQYVSNGGFSAGSLAAIQAIDTLDADNDGTTNGAEIIAGTDPSGSTTTSSTGDASTTGCMTSSFSTPLMMFLTLLTLGFFLPRKNT